MPAKSFRTKNNVSKAWTWIKSNPDRVIKDWYGMRGAYHNFSVIEESLMSKIVSELRLDTYSPTQACKVYLPKASGGLRPYTLLTVQDQVVYQAIINIVAEQLLPNVKNRYYDKTFGNLYAGTQSQWFYKKWKAGYKRFNESARRAHKDGKVFMASFDLVACYDSIDHKVLSYYLKEIGVPEDAINLLKQCLTTWTSTDHEERIYQGHGIPQGPMSSGLLSEVVLSAFDSERRTSGVTYIRYVDDIWFFAKNEYELRSELVRMDRICKKIGLFPQSSKINIGEVKDIEEKIKTVSAIFEEQTEKQEMDFFKVLREVTPAYRIKDISKFKYCAAAAKPTAQLVDRLWRIYEKQPEIYPQLCSALVRSGRLSQSSRNNITKLLNRRSPYINIHASFVEVLCKINLKTPDATHFGKIIKNRFGTSSVFRNSDARLTAIVFEFLYKYGRLTPKQIEYICNSPFWYTRREIARFLKSTESIQIKKFLYDEVPDVQLAAANSVVEKDIQIPSGSLPQLPRVYFQSYDLITGGIAESCKINSILSTMLDKKINFDWKNLLGGHYKQALRVLVDCNASITTNINAWICELDVFNETILRGMCDKDASLGKIGPHYGSMLNDSNHPFGKKHKSIRDLCKSIHDRRITTLVAHAYDQKKHIPTRPFKHNELRQYRRKEISLISAIEQIV